MEKTIIDVKSFKMAIDEMRGLKASQNKFKEFMEKFVLERVQEMYVKVGEQSEECLALDRKTIDFNVRLDNFNDCLQRYDNRMDQYSANLCFVEDKANTLESKLKNYN